MNDIFIPTQYGEVYGQAVGDPANPLVLGLHGWNANQSWQTWEPMLLPLADAGYYVVSVDMPGWGRSIPAKPLTMSGGLATAVVLAILNELNVATAVLMGKSWGGSIALMLAIARPERVSKLILTAPAFRMFKELRTLQQPVLLAWAEDDPVIPVTQAQHFVDALPNCQLERYLTGGHSAAQNNVEDFAPKAIKFLKD